MSARVAVLAFPGSCDDRDALRAVALVGAEPVRVWHADDDLDGASAVIVPGGFSYGDYLRPGALAALSPAMAAVRDFAASGGPVLGICNGFQVLTEAGLLPGILRPNTHLQFRCEEVGLRVQHESAWIPGAVAGDILTIPVKHHDGCFFATADQLDALVLAVGEAEGAVQRLSRDGIQTLLRSRSVSIAACSIRPWRRIRPSTDPSTGSTACSGCGMSPATLPASLVTHAIDSSEPLGLRT